MHIAPLALGPTEALAAPPIELPVTFDGGLTLLGYALDRSALKPGETAHLETMACG